MKYLGTVKLTQIQRDRLKIGEKPNQTYKPDPILVVDAIRLTPQGVIGITADGGEMVDVHHQNHPNTRNVENRNSISVGFSALYHQMQERFGEMAKLGIAGENLIIENADAFDIHTIGSALVIETANGQKITLTVGNGIPPCRPFTRYMTQKPNLDGDELESHLQFLSDGMRGFYLFLAGGITTNPIIQTGDKVYMVD
jgi:hypothetical protein